MIGIILAALINLAPGMNNIGQSGELVAVSAATAEETATVNLQKVSTLTTYTNIVDEVVSYETAYHVTLPVAYTASTNDTADFSFSQYTWTTLHDIVLASNVRYIGPNNYMYIGGCELTAYRPDGKQIVSTMYPNYLIDIAIPGDTTTISLFVLPRSNIQDAVEGMCYYTISYGMDDVEAITLPAGTVLSSQFVLADPRVSSFTYTGGAVTNVVGYVDYDAFKDESGKSLIIGDPVRYDMAITNEVVTGQAIAEIYTATNDLATVTTANHFGSVTTNGYLTGEAVLVTGAGEGDKISILTK